MSVFYLTKVLGHGAVDEIIRADIIADAYDGVILNLR